MSHLPPWSDTMWDLCGRISTYFGTWRPAFPTLKRRIPPRKVKCCWRTRAPVDIRKEVLEVSNDQSQIPCVTKMAAKPIKNVCVGLFFHVIVRLFSCLCIFLTCLASLLSLSLAFPISPRIFPGFPDLSLTAVTARCFPLAPSSLAPSQVALPPGEESMVMATKEGENMGKWSLRRLWLSSNWVGLELGQTVVFDTLTVDLGLGETVGDRKWCETNLWLGVPLWTRGMT